MSPFASQKVLVTGATGFVGGHLAKRLLQLKADVSILARATSDTKVLEVFRTAGAKVILGDVGDSIAVDSAVSGQNYVFHCAALYREAKFDNQEYFRVNLDGSKNIINAAAKHKVIRVVHTSTIGVHSHIGDTPANESEPYLPTDVYQVSKTEAEKYARGIFEKNEVAGTVIRPAMIWGEGDRRILKLFRGIASRTLPIIGSGKTWTHWIYVQDLVDSYLLAAEKPAAIGQTYIIAGRKPVLLEDVFETLARIAGVKPLPFRVPAWPIQLAGSLVELVCKPFNIEPPLHRRRCDFFIKNRHFDTSKAQKELGFAARMSFEEEASIIFKWYKEAGWI